MAENLRSDIQAAKDKMQSRFGAGREMKRLTNHLWEGETVHLMAGGRYGGGLGLVALTDIRLLFVMDGMTRQTVEDFPLDKISSVQWSAGMIQGTLTIFASGNKADIDHVEKKDGKQIADALRARLAGAARRHAPAPMAAPPMAVPAPMAAPMPPQGMAPAPGMVPPAAPVPDVYDQLRKLGELRDLGIVTPEEFEAKKRELLARI
jgi:hypothetical protein